ncbi:MAG TPA: efflux RND transporter periplasmic adaptor subunit [Dissulfurispiraceae bacterium]|nr:efflux RND transporter periplasmic adaptor subunit [Dissulfurispiraceae bacterium]
MNRKYRAGIGFIAVLAIIAGIVTYNSLKGTAVRPAPGPSSSVSAAAPAGHQGHGDASQTQTKAEPARAATSEEPPTVEISPDRQQLIGVKIAEAVVTPLQKVIRTVGRIEYDERRIATANTKVEGWIERLYVDYTGRYVTKGEPLAEIYSPDLYATQQEYLHLLKWEKQNAERKNGAGSDMLSRDSRALVEAARQRLKLWDISDAQIKKIEQGGNPMRTLTIHSPVSGYVVQKMAIKGMRVMPGEKLFDVADLSSVWIVSDVYGYELSLIKVGQTAAISLSYFPGKEYTAKVDFVYPSLSAETRTSKIRFTMANPNRQLKPLMFTNVEIKIPLGKKLAIPQDAVIDTGMRKIVYVDKGEGYFEPREIQTGIKAEGFIEVIKGLQSGEKVAASANFLIDSEAKLKGIVK